MSDPSPTDQAQQSLSRRFIKSSLWNGMNMTLGMALRLGGNLILTRLLLPDAFGLMAFATMVIVGATLLADIGVQISVMRSKDGDDPHFLRAAWTVNFIRGGVISLIILLLALLILPIAMSYAEPGTVLAAPELLGVTAIAAFAPFLKNAQSANVYLAHRRLEIRRLAIFEMSVRAVGLAALLVAVWYYPTVWSLVIVSIGNIFLQTVLSHVVLPGPRMAFVYDKEISARLWDFGKWIIASSFFGFLGNFSERILFAAAIDITTYGLYAVARLWADAAKQLFVFAMKNAGVSALGEVMRKGDRPLAGPFRRLQLGVDVLVVCGFLGFFFLIGPFIEIVYNDTFDPASQYAPLLSLLALRLRFNTFGTLLLAAGESRTMAWVTLTQAITAWVLIWFVLGTLTFESAVVAYAASGLSNVPILLYAARKHLPGKSFVIDWIWWVACVSLAAIFVWIYAQPDAAL